MGDLESTKIIANLFVSLNLTEERLSSIGLKSISIISEGNWTPRMQIILKNDEKIIIDGESGVLDYLNTIKNKLNFS